MAKLRGAALIMALVMAGCAPAVPDLTGLSDDAAAVAVGTESLPASSTTTTTSAATTTTSATSAPPAPTTSTTTTTTTTTTSQASTAITVGLWTLDTAVRDESGAQFSAIVAAPELSADVDPALLARVTTLVDGHVESQVGATLALWRSIEEQGDRDLTGSTLEMEYEVAGFVEDFITLRFFSDEQVAGSGGVKRQVTTLMVDLAAGIEIGLDDIIFGGESRVALLDLVSDGLLVGYFDGDEETFALWAANLEVGDLDRVVLTTAGLEVWFDQLEVGPPTIGIPVVLLPYDELTTILDPAGPVSLFG